AHGVAYGDQDFDDGDVAVIPDVGDARFLDFGHARAPALCVGKDPPIVSARAPPANLHKRVSTAFFAPARFQRRPYVAASSMRFHRRITCTRAIRTVHAALSRMNCRSRLYA